MIGSILTYFIFRMFTHKTHKPTTKNSTCHGSGSNEKQVTLLTYFIFRMFTPIFFFKRILKYFENASKCHNLPGFDKSSLKGKAISKFLRKDWSIFEKNVQIVMFSEKCCIELKGTILVPFISEIENLKKNHSSLEHANRHMDKGIHLFYFYSLYQCFLKSFDCLLYIYMYVYIYIIFVSLSVMFYNHGYSH